MKYLTIEGIQIQGYGGKDNLGNFVSNLVDVVGFDSVESIGVIQDADQCAQSALEGVKGRLLNASLPVPSTFLIPSGESPTTRIFVMPDNSGNGALEDLCLSAVTDDPAMPCVNEYMEGLTQRAVSPPENRKAKARMQAFLASRNDPDSRLGIAAARGYFEWSHPSFSTLAEFLRAL